MLKNLRAIAIWLLPPLGVFALPTDAPGLTCLAMIQLYLGGLFLALVFFVKVFATRNKPHSASALVMVAILWLLAWQHGFTVGARIHLFVNESRYMATIAEIDRAQSREEKNRIGGEEYHLYGEPPVVVVHYCHCFLSWPDLVYDPHGTLDAHRDDLGKVSLYLHGYKRLSKNWYIGYFGD